MTKQVDKEDTNVLTSKNTCEINFESVTLIKIIRIFKVQRAIVKWCDEGRTKYNILIANEIRRTKGTISCIL